MVLVDVPRAVLVLSLVERLRCERLAFALACWIGLQRGVVSVENPCATPNGMNDVAFWKLDTLSDRQLLQGLGAVLGSGRRLTAELIAHLGEVEDRRLHLEAACSSMFSYCVNRLGLSEDEACRRIEVARLARRYPAMFPLLASGKLSLSVAALLKPHLSAENPLARPDPLNGLDPLAVLELLTAVSGRSVQQAREVLAARYPRPDVPSSVRKLPERRAAQPLGRALGGAGQSAPGRAPVGAETLSTATLVSPAPSATAASTATHSVPQPSFTTPSSVVGRVILVPETSAGAGGGTTSTLQPSVASLSPTSGFRAGRIEPLAAQRYKVQFTADTELKGKLELARDLMRHAHPSGDFAPIILRALDLLIEDLMKKRFGAGARRKAPSTAEPSVGSNLSRTAMPSGTAKPSDRVAPCDTAEPFEPGLSDISKPLRPAKPSSSKQRSATANTRADAAARVTRNDCARTTPSENGHAGVTPSDVALPASQTAKSRHVRRAARRSVLERDGLRCSWVDAGGARCDSRAWLEHDHRQPLGKGGDSEPDNVRLLCRAHNCLAAEREYGRQHMQQAVAQRRWERARPTQRPPPR